MRWGVALRRYLMPIDGTVDDTKARTLGKVLEKGRSKCTASLSFCHPGLN